MTDQAMSAQETKEEGLRLFQEGLYPEAAERFESARRTFDSEGDVVEAGEMLNNLGIVYRMQRKWDRAVAALEEARVAFANLGDREVLGNLGGLYASQRDRDKAMTSLQEAADIFADVGDKQREGETLLALGVQQWKSGDRKTGLATYQTGLETLENPSAGQKALRGLLNLRTRLLGTS